MRNINELIGIVKGISFDEIINENEVSRLKEWLEENRTLASNQMEKQLVDLIDDILEDNIITSDEGKTLLQFASGIISDDDEANTIYELEGIIDGIICDDVLNEEEMRRLENWLSDRPVLLERDESIRVIVDKVKDILEDDVVTQEKQKELMLLLKDKLEEISYNAKILELKHMVNSRQNIGLKILDILSSNKAVSKIHSIAMNQLNSAIQSYGISDDRDYSSLFISLCLIALRHYDGNFYEHVRAAYKPIYDRYSEQKVEGTIRTILNKYQYNVDTGNETRVINSVLYNTIVPRMFLESFFEFIYDIYKLNFDYCIPEDLQGEFEFVYNGLRKEMLSNDDSLTVNVTRKSYKLIQTTKRLILNEKYKDLVIDFSTIILLLIDSRINGEEQFVDNPYIAYGYKAWLDTLDTSDSNQRHRRSDLEGYGRVAKITFDDEGVTLVTPVYHISSDIDYSKIAISVTNNDEVLYYDDCPSIKEIIGGYEVASQKVPLEKPLGELRCCLMEGDTVLKSTDSSLYRDIIVFDESGREIRDNTDYEGTVIICTIPGTDIGIEPFSYEEGYNLCTESVEIGDVIHSGKNLFAFSSYLKPEVIGNIIDHQYLKEDGSDMFIPVYSGVDFLVFESSAAPEKINIKLNNYTSSLTDMKFDVKKHVDARIYTVDLKLNNSDIYTVEAYEVDDFTSNLICRKVFGLDLLFNVSKTRVSDSEYLISIESDLCNGKYNNEFNISEYEYDWLKILRRGKQYSYIVPLDLNLFRIRGREWHAIEDGIWIDDISQDSVLELLNHDANTINVSSASGEQLNEKIDLKDKLTHKEVSVGFLQSYKEQNDFVCLWLIKNERAINALYCYNKCLMDIDHTSVAFDNIKGTLNVYPVFHGRGNVRLEITNRNGDVECSSNDVLSGQILQVEGLDSFKDYTITLYELIKGLTIKSKKRKMISWHRKLYAIKDFVGRFFKIKRIKYDDYRGVDFIRREYQFTNTYIHIIDRTAVDKFKANVVIKIRDKYYRLKEINPVDVELCSGVVDGEIELMVTNEGDGLLIDFEHRGVMASLDADAPDIYSYYMDVNGVTL